MMELWTPKMYDRLHNNVTSVRSNNNHCPRPPNPLDCPRQLYCPYIPPCVIKDS